MIYIVIFTFLLVFSLLGLGCTKKHLDLESWMFYFSIYILYILAAFRYETGGDWPGYKAIFDGSDQRAFMEPFFSIIIFFARKIGHYQYIFIFSELIRFVLLVNFINKSSLLNRKTRILFLLFYYTMFYFHLDFIIIRQACAVNVFIQFFVSKKSEHRFLYYLFYCMLAACFHSSALILVFLYPIIYKQNIKFSILMSLTFVLFFLLRINIISEIFILILNFLPDNALFSRLYAYTQIATLAAQRNLSGQTLVYMLVFFCYSFVNLRNKNITKDDIILQNCLMCFHLFYYGLSGFGTLSVRFSTFFSLFNILAIIKICMYFKNLKIFLPCFIILAFCFNKNIFLLKPDKVAYFPYQSYLTEISIGIDSDGAERLKITNSYTEKLKKME